MKVTAIDTIKAPSKQLKRVAGYARVSVETDMSVGSFNAQVNYLKKLISSNRSWVDCGVFLDLGISGTRTNRPGFQSLMAKCEEGKVDLIITKSISRFCRNTVDLLQTTRRLKDLGVEVYFDENRLSTFSKEGELLLTLLASQAQEESRSISENVLWSIRKRFEKGVAQPKDLFGYRWNGGKYCIVEDEAAFVRMIFNLYLNGIGPQEICNRINALGAKSLTGIDFGYNTVWAMLRQEKYMGDSILQKTYTEDHITHHRVKNRGEMDMFYAEGTHPPIITKEVFEKTQREIERRKDLGSVAINWTLETSMFTSRIVCQECGRTFRRKSCSCKGQKPYFKWACGEKFDKRKGGCASMAVPERFLYESALEIIGKENFSQEEFFSRVSQVRAGRDHEVLFVMADGTEVKKSWKKRRSKNA